MKSMSDKQKAEELAEQAIETAIEGDEAKARELAERAKSIDSDAAAKVADDAEADAEAAAPYVNRVGDNAEDEAAAPDVHKSAE